MSDAPKTIWLQRPCTDPENEWVDSVTWCEDKQNDDDTEYVRADEIERNRAAIAELVGALERCLRRATPHPDDTDADRVRNLLHIEANARAAIAKHTTTTKEGN